MQSQPDNQPLAPDAGLAAVVGSTFLILVIAFLIILGLFVFTYITSAATAQSTADEVAQAVSNANILADLTSADFVAGAQHVVTYAQADSVLTQVAQPLFQSSLGPEWAPGDTVSCYVLPTGTGDTLTAASARDGVRCTVTMQAVGVAPQLGVWVTRTGSASEVIVANP